MVKKLSTSPAVTYCHFKNRRITAAATQGSPTLLLEIVAGKKVKVRDLFFWVDIEAGGDLVEEDIEKLRDLCTWKLREIRRHKKKT